MRLDSLTSSEHTDSSGYVSPGTVSTVTTSSRHSSGRSSGGSSLGSPVVSPGRRNRKLLRRRPVWQLEEARNTHRCIWIYDYTWLSVLVALGSPLFGGVALYCARKCVAAARQGRGEDMERHSTRALVLSLLGIATMVIILTCCLSFINYAGAVNNSMLAACLGMAEPTAPSTPTPTTLPLVPSTPAQPADYVDHYFYALLGSDDDESSTEIFL